MHRRQVRVRLVLMFLLLALLLVATVPTAFFSWQEDPYDIGDLLVSTENCMAAPAVCFFNLESGTLTWNSWHSDYLFGRYHTISIRETASFGSMILSTLVLFVGFSTRIVKMSHRMSKTIHKSLRRPISCISQNVLRCLSLYTAGDLPRNTWHEICYLSLVQPLLAFFIAVRIIMDLYNSLFAEVFLYDPRSLVITHAKRQIDNVALYSNDLGHVQDHRHKEYPPERNP